MHKRIMFIVVGMLAMALDNAGFSTAALAQRACREGTTLAGECVNPGLAASQRRRAIVYTQPKFSTSVMPALVLPRDSREYYLTRDYRELNHGVFSTSPFPYSCHPHC